MRELKKNVARKRVTFRCQEILEESKKCKKSKLDISKVIKRNHENFLSH